MYIQIKTTEKIEMHNGIIRHPVATLKDEYGSMCQIVNDDHCYIVCLIQQDGKYKPIFHLFKEVIQVLKKLPLLE